MRDFSLTVSQQEPQHVGNYMTGGRGGKRRSAEQDEEDINETIQQFSEINSFFVLTFTAHTLFINFL